MASFSEDQELFFFQFLVFWLVDCVSISRHSGTGSPKALWSYLLGEEKWKLYDMPKVYCNVAKHLQPAKIASKSLPSSTLGNSPLLLTVFE